MEFLCGNCDGIIDAPEELAGTVVSCPHCGQELVVPEAEAEEIYEEAIYTEEVLPARREKVRKRPEEKLGWALWLLILLVVATMGVGAYYAYLNVSAFGNWVDETFGIERSARDRVGKVEQSGPKGVIPAGYYVASVLSGMSGAGAETTSWDAPGEEGQQEWIVVAASVPAEVFVMPEERYEAMKSEYAERYGEDGTKLFPEIGECRFFDPGKVALVWPDGEELAGVLINLDFGVFRGFYRAFESHPQPGVRDDDWVRTGEQMPVEVAFAMDEGVFDPVGMRIKFGDREPVALPATKLK
ncbi:MAG: hypothetical protein AAGD22_17410 [Verrucomicrobiota bacterium]